jgi:hypothetical protein
LGNYKRAGGRFIYKEGSYYLPVQGSEQDYGTSVNLIKIKNISPDKLLINKTVIPYVKPFPDIKYFYAGVHQLDIQSFDGKYFYVIDGRGSKKEQRFVLQLRSSIVKNIMDILDYLGIYNIPSFLY